MAKAKLYAADGSFKAETELPSSHFEQEINEHLVFMAVEVYLANQRQGTHKGKNRSEVSGGGKKPWKQKGTGRARQGSNTAPNWARGGKAHPPLPRSYRKTLTKKMRRAALLSALSMKAKDAGIHVFEKFALTAPKTKDFLKVMQAASLEGQKNLFLLDDADHNFILSSRNVPNVRVGRVQDLNAYELVRAKNVIFTQKAVEALVGAANETD